MSADLKPRSIGDVFDTAFDLYKHNFALFAGITAILQAPAVIALGWASLYLDIGSTGRNARSTEDVGMMFGVLGLILVLEVVYLFLYAINGGALTIAVSERLLGRPISIGEAYRRLRPHAGRLVGAWIIIGLLLAVSSFVLFMVFAFVGVMVVGMIAMAAGSGGAAGVVAGIVMVVLMGVVPAVGFMALLTAFGVFATQAVTIEGAGATDVVSRNWALVRGRFWPPCLALLGLVLLIGCLQLAIVGSMEFILEMVLYSWLPLSHMAQTVITQAINAVLSLCLQPFFMIVLTVLYFDQRVRREGFDIELALYERDTRQALETAG